MVALVSPSPFFPTRAEHRTCQKHAYVPLLSSLPRLHSFVLLAGMHTFFPSYIPSTFVPDVGTSVWHPDLVNHFNILNWLDKYNGLFVLLFPVPVPTRSLEGSHMVPGSPSGRRIQD